MRMLTPASGSFFSLTTLPVSFPVVPAWSGVAMALAAAHATMRPRARIEVLHMGKPPFLNECHGPRCAAAIHFNGGRGVAGGSPAGCEPCIPISPVHPSGGVGKGNAFLGLER